MTQNEKDLLAMEIRSYAATQRLMAMARVAKDEKAIELWERESFVLARQMKQRFGVDLWFDNQDMWPREEKNDGND